MGCGCSKGKEKEIRAIHASCGLNVHSIPPTNMQITAGHVIQRYPHHIICDFANLQSGHSLLEQALNCHHVLPLSRLYVLIPSSHALLSSTREDQPLSASDIHFWHSHFRRISRRAHDDATCQCWRAYTLSSSTNTASLTDAIVSQLLSEDGDGGGLTADTLRTLSERNLNHSRLPTIAELSVLEDELNIT